MTKVALVALCLLASHGAMAKDYYLAPNGTGNGMTIDKPFGDPVKAFAALKAGDILYVRGGTYHRFSFHFHCFVFSVCFL